MREECGEFVSDIYFDTPRQLRYAQRVLRTFLKSKLHLACVTDANVAYEGSVAIDQSLLEQADIAPYEQVHIWDVTNGQRLVTYAIAAPPGSGAVRMNGAGAHLMHVGDRVIIASFATLSTDEAQRHHPRQFLLDGSNQIVRPLP